MELKGHHAEVWGLSVSSIGDFLVTSSNDRSLRIWQQTQEQLFLEEERENRLEALFDEGAVVEEKRIGMIEGSGIEPERESTAVAGKDTKPGKASLMAGEKIIEAIEIAEQENKRWAAYYRAVKRRKLKREELTQEKTSDRSKSDDLASMFNSNKESLQKEIRRPALNILLRGTDSEGYVLRTLKSIRGPQLEQAMMLLPFGIATKLIHYLGNFIEKTTDTELCMRCLLFMLTIHQDTIVANQLLIEPLNKLRKTARHKLMKHKDEMGYNLAGLKLLKQIIKSEKNANFFDEE